MPNAWIEVGGARRGAVTYLSILGYGLIGLSSVVGLRDTPDNVLLVTVADTPWIFRLYCLGLAAAFVAGVVSSWNLSRLGESYAAFTFAGMVGLHGATILLGESESDYLGLRMLGTAPMLIAWGLMLRRSHIATANVRKDLIGKERT